MVFPDEDPTVQRGDRTLQLIDLLVERLEECLGEVLPLQTDDLLKEYAKDAGASRKSSNWDVHSRLPSGREIEGQNVS